MKVLPNPDDPNAGGQATKQPDGSGSGSGTPEGKSDVAGADPQKSEGVQPGGKGSDSAQTSSGSETITPEKGEPEVTVTDEDLAKATPKVAKEYRQVKRENVGLKATLESVQKDAEDAPVLRSEKVRLERENMLLTLAIDYGLDPNLLKPLTGTKEQIEDWIKKYTVAPKEGAGKTENQSQGAGGEGKREPETASGKSASEGEGSGGGLELPGTGKEPPPPKKKGDQPDLSGMTDAEKRAYWRERL